MKLLKIILCLSLLWFVSASFELHQNRVSVTGRNIALKQAFEQIEKQSEYTVAYNQSLFDAERKITPDIKDALLEDALCIILKNSGFTYKLNGRHIVITPELYETGQKEEVKKTLKLQGIVKDEQTGEPLVFASLGLVKYPIGVCTNRFGEFQMAVDDSLSSCELTVSMLGYEPRRFELARMAEGYFEILLKPAAILLGEVQALPPVTAEEIIRLVIKNHTKNYPFGFHYYETFFRHLVVNEAPNAAVRDCRLTEAAVNIEDFGLDSGREPKLLAHEVRNSFSYVETAKSWLFAIFGDTKPQNPVAKVYNTQRIIERSNLKQLLRNKHYSKEITETVMLDGEPIYKVEIRKRTAKYLGEIYDVRLNISVNMYVNPRNWAVLQVEDKTVDDINGKQDPIAYCNIKMQELNGQYYLKMIDYYGFIRDEQRKIDYKGGNAYRDKATLMVNQVVDDRKGIERIKRRNAMKADMPLWNMEYTYNPEFWDNYSVLPDQPIDPSIKQNLERDAPLDTQFKDGGQRNAKKPIY